MKFLILHWSFGTSESNWFPYLKNQLEIIWQDVISPSMPIEDFGYMLDSPNKIFQNQTLENWLDYFADIYKEIWWKKICVVAHSMWPLFLLHLLERYDLDIDSSIFVAPFLRLEKFWWNLFPLDKVNQSFYRDDFDFDKIKKKISNSYVLYSEDDPYVPSEKSIEFAQKLDSSMILVQNSWHMNSEAKLDKFPLIFELCKTRLNYPFYT